MIVPRTERAKTLSILMLQAGVDTARLAEVCGISYSYMRSIVSGRYDSDKIYIRAKEALEEAINDKKDD